MMIIEIIGWWWLRRWVTWWWRFFFIFIWFLFFIFFYCIITYECYPLISASMNDDRSFLILFCFFVFLLDDSHLIFLFYLLMIFLLRDKKKFTCSNVINVYLVLRLRRYIDELRSCHHHLRRPLLREVLVADFLNSFRGFPF